MIWQHNGCKSRSCQNNPEINLFIHSSFTVSITYLSIYYPMPVFFISHKIFTNYHTIILEINLVTPSSSPIIYYLIWHDDAFRLTHMKITLSIYTQRVSDTWWILMKFSIWVLHMFRPSQGSFAPNVHIWFFLQSIQSWWSRWQGVIGRHLILWRTEGHRHRDKIRLGKKSNQIKKEKALIPYTTLDLFENNKISHDF